MVDKRQDKRRKLKDALIAAAERQIVSGGLDALRARDLATEVGCALGALYNVFADIDDLIIHVSSRTLFALGAALASTSEATANRAAGDQMIALAHTYLDFAVENTNAWSALFDHRMREGKELPEWHLQEQDVLFLHVIRPLRMLVPEIDEQTAALTARTLFSAVHGVVALGLQHRFAAVPPREIRNMLTLLVGNFAKAEAAH
jgi:AcrR family transcriptional regulator